MQTLEAALSLLVFASILLAVLPYQESQRGTDDSLYRMQLAEDAWRVLYLRGDFQDFGDGKHEAIERDINAIGRQTSLCIFLDGMWSTNCRGGVREHDFTIRIRRNVVAGGTPKRVVFSLGN